MVNSTKPSLYFLSAILGGLLVFQLGCDNASITGSLNENQPPKTYFSVDKIDVPEDIRFASRVHISWWGVDPDGYVVGFEWAIGVEGEEEWRYTERNDSTFLMPIPQGEKEANVRFTIRAIDNDGARDPDPPSLVFPVENSPPTIAWSSSVQVPDTTFEFFSFGWNADDPDGEEDLSRIEFAINDTNGIWTQVSAEVDLISLRIINAQVQPAEAELFVGRAVRRSNEVVQNFRVNADNRVYIRAVDHAGERSGLDSLDWYLKEQTSRVLVLNDDDSVDGDQRLAYHLDLLRAAGIDRVDIKHITEGQTLQGEKVAMSNNLHSPVDPTLNRVLAEWDYIYWFSNNLDRHIVYGREILDRFLLQGGKLFTNIPTKNLPDGDPAFDILPTERLERPPAGASSFVIWGNRHDVTPYPGEEANLPALRLQRTQTSVLPIVAPGGARILYEAPFETRPPMDYEGSNIIATVDPDNRIAYFGIGLWDFREDVENVELFIRYVLNDILEFKN